MKILVCISNVPDTTAKISFSADNTTFNAAGVQFIINPYDEWFALVRALELKEAQGGNVTIIHVGAVESEATIRKGLAIGADDAVRIDAEPNDAFAVAEQIAAYAKDKGFDLILVGKETISYNGSMVGAMLAELMNLPYVSLATKLDVTNSVAKIEHDIDGGIEVLECALPLVISANKGMAEQRIPNMKGIMSARTKPLLVVPPAAADKLTSITSFTLTAGRTDCKYIDAATPEKLIELLHTEAKVI
ncbi:MAG: electron transfer flavoprotein subunit beta/FixA family protein [Bacteroidetes bacterium]|jgi:electron transfer flavoprotein beta subunit|nr:electron transfer flavoprotein subunit beta/FixA family protein [Bacteroidota bacterium]